MKSKELVYLASTAILLAATANVAKAEEHTIAESEVLKTERSVSSQNQTVNAAASQTSNQPTVAVSSAEQSVQAVKQEEEATNATGTAVESGGAAQSVPVETQVASAKPEVQSQPDANASNQNETAADQSAKASSSVADSAIASEPKASPAVASAPKASNAGKTVFYNAGSKAQAARGNSQAEIKGTSFVDVSSHNGHISVDDYRKLAQQGVGGVVVKLTEGTHYTNPFAESQVRNAQGAGLQVSTYAFSHYTNDEEARAEARYYVAFANRLGLPKNTVMVNDMEDPKMQNGINQHTLAWADEMRRLGYSNLMYYTSASWLDQNNLRSKGPVNTSQFGYSNFWVAQYPSSNLNLDGAKSLKYNSDAGAWQFTAQAQLLAGKHVFDHSVDYSGRFTQQSALAKQPLNGNISIQNKNNVNGSFDVVISNVSAPYGVSVVSVPVWSEANGQDDIIWYTATQQANGTYKVSVDSSRHKDSVGKYNVHLYYVRNDGQLVGVGGTTTNVSAVKPQGKISIQNRNSENGDFDIVVSDIVSPGGLKTVSLPTWSEANGQDDIKWYNAERQPDGTYRKHVYARDHNNVQGEYNVHLYYLNNQNQLQGAGGEKTSISVNRPQATNQRDRVLAAAAAMVGVRGGSAEHQRLVNDYNSVRPLPVGYAVKNTDDWCDIFTTVIFQREGLSDLIGRECGVERHIHIFQRLGIWNEDGNSTPSAGDIITFNWDKDTQQNDGWADHIGIVEKVENGIIHTIEGNSNNVVKRNTYRIGHGNIRGFATPRYR